MAVVNTLTLRLMIQRIPGDENCLFGAICHQIYDIQVKTEQYKAAVLNLRNEVVNYLRQNCEITRIKNCIISRIADEFPQYNLSNYQDKVTRFTRFLSINNNWGGEETIIACVEMMNISLNIHYELGAPRLFNPTIGTSSRTINIVYRLAGTDRHIYNHYDSVLNSSSSRVDGVPLSKRSLSYDDLVDSIQNKARLGDYSLRNQSQGSDQFSIDGDGVDDVSFLNLCSLNVRGCNKDDKRDAIDLTLMSSKAHIACLQETKLVGSDFQTMNYVWHLFEAGEDAIGHRCNAILVSKKAPLKCKFHKVSANISSVQFLWFDMTVHIINVHIPSDKRSSIEFSLLNKYVRNLGSKNVIIIGDFNAHIDFKDKTPTDEAFIGPNLFHEFTNANGDDLKNFIHLTKFKLKNSFVKSRTLMTTWRCNDRFSQIDHVLFSPVVTFVCHNMIASWTLIGTDHKLIKCLISPEKGLNSDVDFNVDCARTTIDHADDTNDMPILQTVSGIDELLVNNGRSRKSSWNVRNFSNEKAKSSFCLQLHTNQS